MNWNGLTLNSFWYDKHRFLFNKDCRKMSDLPDEYAQCVVTSPPYWGLRKYAGLPDLIWGGDGSCEHQWKKQIVKGVNPQQDNSGGFSNPTGRGQQAFTKGTAGELRLGVFCSLCGAWQGQLGLEPTPEMYIDHLVEIFREVKRVIRRDGCVFLNIGDNYFGGGNNRGNNSPISAKQASNFGAVGQCAEHQKNIGKHPVLKPKDLCLIPFRLAIALQEDGWWVRSVIIWNKPNPMPESVRDRPTESHEYILMLTKSARYYYDQEAVREPNTLGTLERAQNKQGTQSNSKRVKAKDPHDGTYMTEIFTNGRNLRSVWTAPNQMWQLRADLSEADRAFVLGELLKREILSSKNGNDNDQNE